MKFMLRLLAVAALAALTADVCLGATAGGSVTKSGSVIKKHESLINRKQLAAIRPAHAQAQRGARLNVVPRNNVSRSATAADGQRALANAAPMAMKNASIVSVTATVPAATAVRARAFRVTPLPGPAAHDGAVSGTGKLSTSTLAALGGATRDKGTAALNGSRMQPKKR